MNHLALFPTPCSGQKQALNIQRAPPRPRKGWEEVQKPRKGPEEAPSQKRPEAPKKAQKRPQRLGKRSRSLEKDQKRPRGQALEKVGKRSKPRKETPRPWHSFPPASQTPVPAPACPIRAAPCTKPVLDSKKHNLVKTWSKLSVKTVGQNFRSKLSVKTRSKLRDPNPIQFL